MMERRRALTIPFTVDKDNLMENPFRIPTTYLSPECGKLETQVSWTAFASCKPKHHRDSQHRNGSMMFDHNHAAMVKLGLARRKPCLILTDVLKTEQGKAYMEQKNRTPHVRNNEQVSSKERWRCREQTPFSRDRKSHQGETRNEKNKSVTPKQKQTSSPTSLQRSRLRRRLQNDDDDEEDKDEDEDIEEVIIGKDGREDYKFAEVVDCGLSLRWEHPEDTGSCKFSPSNIKDRWTDPESELQHGLKRKVKDAETHCTETDTLKRPRESVLRLSGGNTRDGGPAHQICPEESAEDRDLESLDRGIVQFTVGADENEGSLIPIMSPSLEAGHFTGAIVLSSDDEDGGEGTVTQEQPPQEAVSLQQEADGIEDMQVLHVVVDDLSGSVAVAPIPSVDNTGLGLAFSTLHCGRYQGKTNGDILITDDKILIPLKDTSEQVKVILTMERKELRRYSIWEQQELDARGLHCTGNEKPQSTAVLFCVSEAAAAAIQRDLHRLCAKQDGTKNTEKASPFILLTLKDSLEGMVGALFRSLLDIDCLNSLAHQNTMVDDAIGSLSGPVLSLDDSLELIRRTGLDPHLLTLLGQDSTVPELETDQECPQLEKNTTSHIQPEVEPQLEPAAEHETRPQLKPEENQEQRELENPSEKSRSDLAPVYTLCHRRLKGSYSVSLSKSDSSWIKYKHQGLPHRLIQFPPPPLKGGITVTMEDLQCLDSGQYLNDVIIDFYLKYLLQDASESVAERSHIFSSFFYKQLTRRDNASEGGTSDSCQRQRRHQRVRTWTRHVDIFKKDFLFVPVNQEAHWYLVVICFPGLDEPKLETWTCPDSQSVKSPSGSEELPNQDEAQGCKSPNNNTEAPLGLNESENTEAETENSHEESTKDPPPGPVNCTEQTCQKKTICKRPCILVMDSLKRSLHERVFKLLREYLVSEWEARRGTSRDFGPDQMKSSHCQVPLQDNNSDCGLYLLQYVESFLKDPVVHFDLPLHLKRWFPRQQVRRKRDEIRDLVLKLYRHQNLDNKR